MCVCVYLLLALSLVRLPVSDLIGESEPGSRQSDGDQRGSQAKATKEHKESYT